MNILSYIWSTGVELERYFVYIDFFESDIETKSSRIREKKYFSSSFDWFLLVWVMKDPKTKSFFGKNLPWNHRSIAWTRSRFLSKVPHSGISLSWNVTECDTPVFDFFADIVSFSRISIFFSASSCLKIYQLFASAVSAVMIWNKSYRFFKFSFSSSSFFSFSW